MRGQPLTLYEREKIEFFLRGRWGIRQIARMLFRNHSVLVRELQRNRDRDGIYRAASAHARSLKRMCKPHRRKLDSDEVLRNHVMQKMREGWSPEQISGRLKNRPELQVSGSYVCHESIYQYIYNGEGRFLGLYQYLAKKHKKRRRKFSRKSRKNKGILFLTPIRYRPGNINEKKEFGHWESDSMVFAGHKAGLSVQRERVTSYCLIRKIGSMRAEETEDALRTGIEIIGPDVWKSITFDRGGEGGSHWKLRMDYGIETYHCDPYASYQKGGVENHNGLIRRYLPKRTDPNSFTQQDVYVIQEKLNHRPRKTLGYKTPHERFQELLMG